MVAPPEVRWLQVGPDGVTAALGSRLRDRLVALGLAALAVVWTLATGAMLVEGELSALQAAIMTVMAIFLIGLSFGMWIDAGLTHSLVLQPRGVLLTTRWYGLPWRHQTLHLAGLRAELKVLTGKSQSRALQLLLHPKDQPSQGVWIHGYQPNPDPADLDAARWLCATLESAGTALADQSARDIPEDLKPLLETST